MIRDLDSVQVTAPRGQEAAARAFYGELLGLREVAKAPGGAGGGGVRFHVGPREVRVGGDLAAGARLALRVGTRRDLRALADRLSAAGHAVASASGADGAERCLVDDPFGNRVELVCRPDAVEVVMVARLPPDGVDEFGRYEAAVLPLLARHGGRLERRLVSPDRRTEVHLVSFPSRAALDAYRDDPDTAAHARLLEASRADVEILAFADR